MYNPCSQPRRRLRIFVFPRYLQPLFATPPPPADWRSSDGFPHFNNVQPLFATLPPPADLRISAFPQFVKPLSATPPPPADLPSSGGFPHFLNMYNPCSQPHRRLWICGVPADFRIPSMCKTLVRNPAAACEFTEFRLIPAFPQFGQPLSKTPPKLADL